MASENKEELLKKIAILEVENEKLLKGCEELQLVKKELESLKKSKEEIIANEHNVRKAFDKSQNELSGLSKTIETKDKQIELLKADLTKLANLFDEYITAYQDQVKMLNVFVKNTQTVEKYLSTKIDEYNGGSKK